MLKRLCLLFVFVFPVLRLSAQLDHERIYAFMNAAMCPDSAKFNLNRSPETWHLYDDTTSIFQDSLFTEADRQCFRRQMKAAPAFEWEENRVQGARLITTPASWTAFSRKHFWRRFERKHDDCLVSFSVPVFSENGQYCIISQAQHWKQSGKGNVALYVKMGDRWQFLKWYSSWRAC